MTDTEKMIREINEITEEDYKREHIFMWEYIINAIKDACLCINKKKAISLIKIKKEYLKKVKSRLKEKEFLNEKDKWLLRSLEKDIQNDCWACEYVTMEKNVETCNLCPLLKRQGGKITHRCFYSASIYSSFTKALKNHAYGMALKLAIFIKDAWREVK